jgi:hypothetical protein
MEIVVKCDEVSCRELMVRAMNYGIHEAKSFIADSLLNVNQPHLDAIAAKLYATCKDPYGRYVPPSSLALPPTEC